MYLKFFGDNEIFSSVLPPRDSIEEKYKWKIEDIYKSNDEWENKFRWVENNLGNYQSFEGKILHSAKQLLSCLKYDESIGIELERLYLYAMLLKDSDLTIQENLSREQKIKSLYAKASAAVSFIKPELLSSSYEKVLQFLGEEKELEIYRHYFDDLFREKPHTLSKESEEILAFSSEVLSGPYETFSIFTNADLKFEDAKDDGENKIPVSHGKYYAALYSNDRTLRRTVTESYYKPFKEYSSTISSILLSSLKGNIFTAKVRKYNSAREASLSKNNIPIEVYDKLISSVSDNISTMHRWTALKKKMLRVEQLFPYDSYVSVFNEKLEKKYSYDDSMNIVVDSLQLMGDEYLSALKTAFNERWIDVFETKGKRSGAYSSGTTFGVHPYVLLNWNDQLNDVFTLTHEMGHNMHSYFTGRNQPYCYANYSIFLAEVASTFNESLLLEFLINNSKDDEEKLFLYEKYLNNVTTTFFRQTMFAEFEKMLYQKIESGNFPTATELCTDYKDVYQKYWGKEMHVTEDESFTWARIPHFYYNFYVYQYATGFAASEYLVQLVKSEGAPAVNRYLNFLKSGNSKYSIDILKDAGVDMLSSQPILAVIKKMNIVLDEIEKILEKRNERHS